MALETGTYISDLVATNPTASDPKAQGDDHIRLLKSTVKVTFPNVSGAVTPTHVELNYVDGVTSAIQTQIDAKGAIAGQVWTGTHNFTGAAVTVPTATAGDNTTKAASTAFVATAAFNSALPSQTGNADKLPTTDGTAASWTDSLKATVLRWVDGTDTTKKLAFVLSGLTTATTRSVTWPDKDGTVAMTSDIAGPSGLVCLAVASASSVATVDFTSLIDSTYDEYELHYISVIPASNSNLLFRTSTDGGATFAASAGNYGWASVANTATGAATGGGSTSDTSIAMNDSGIATVAAAGAGISGVLRLYSPSNTSANKLLEYKSVWIDSSPAVNQVVGGGARLSTADIDAVRFLFSTGNIASGLFKLYGVRKSV